MANKEVIAEAYEDKLKKLCFYLEERIELHDHNLHPDPSLLNELKGILFYAENFLFLEGRYNEELKKKIDSLSGNEPIKDSKKISEVLRGYKQRIKNNIFSSFFSSDEVNEGWYRIDVRNKSPYFGYTKNILNVLNYIRDQDPEFELDDPEEDIINITHCKCFSIDKKNEQNYRCSMLKGPCALAHHANRIECPNLENLVKHKRDFFEDFINGNYDVIEHKSS